MKIRPSKTKMKRDIVNSTTKNLQVFVSLLEKRVTMTFDLCHEKSRKHIKSICIEKISSRSQPVTKNKQNMYTTKLIYNSITKRR